VKRAIVTDRAPRPSGSYSQAVVSGETVFVAGQGPRDPGTMAMPDGITAQTDQTLRNISAILDAAGCTLADVVKVTAHLADVADFAAYDRVYQEYFQAPYPVRTTVGSTLMAGLVEIDVIAIAGSGAAASDG
jgi:2-iminobutanoate/2-iminopropanoate deaminase